MSKLKNLFDLWRPSFNLDVLRVSISGSLVNELYEYVGTAASVAFLTYEYFLKFVNFERYIKINSKNSATPETLETIVAEWTSSSWDASYSRDPIHIRDPEEETNAIRKTATAGPTAADVGHQPLQGHQNQWNWKH